MNYAVVTLVVCLAVTTSCTSIRRNEDLPKVLDCSGDTITEPGEYFVVGDPHEESPGQCEILFLASANENIEISVTEANFNCSLKPYYALMFDGVNMGQGFFPPMANDASGLKEQFKQVCDAGSPEVAIYRTSTNALTLMHTLSTIDGIALKFTIRFINTHHPCNVVVASEKGVHVLQNVGSAWQNCSLLILQPARITLDYLRIGHSRMLDSTLRTVTSSRRVAENVLSSLGQRCARISRDMLVIAPFPYDGSESPSALRLCGDLNYAVTDVHRYAVTTCGPATINLQSAGRFRNRAIVSWFAADQPEEASHRNADQCLALSHTNMAVFLHQLV